MLSEIKRFKGSRTLRNGGWLYMLQVFNTVIPMLTVPYITRILGAAQYGVFSLALNYVGYLQVIVEYGFGMSATRKVALMKDGEDFSYLSSAVIFARLLLTAFCGLFLLLFVLFNNDTTENICTVILFLSLIGYAVQQNFFFQGREDMEYIAVINIITRVAMAVTVFLFVKERDDIYLYSVLYATAPLISGVLGLFLVRKKYRIRLRRVPFAVILSELKDGWYVFTTQLSSKVFGAIGITFLGVFASHSDVGVYSAIQKIPMLVLFLWSPISQVMYPVSSKKMNESFWNGYLFIKKCRGFFLVLFGILIITVGFFSKAIVGFAFGKEYTEYAWLSIPLLIRTFLGINNNFWGIQLLLGGGFDREYNICFQISVVCTIMVNLLAIFWGGVYGAAAACAVSEMILTVLLYWKLGEIKKRENYII